MTDVFISYSHKDSKYAHRLADELKRRHIDVWIDDHIDYGDEWPKTIQENLSACRTVIVIMSTNALNSRWVQNEVSYAQANEKTILPLLLEGQIWLSMAAMQYGDGRGEKMPPARFFEKVQASLARSAPVSGSSRIDLAVGKQRKKHKTNTGTTRPALYIGGVLLVLAVAVGTIYYFRLYDSPSTPPATEPPATEEPADVPGEATYRLRELGLISFISARDGNPEGYIMNADGTAQRNVTNTTAMDEGLSLSPDGKKIAFQSNWGGNTDIYVANADGSNPIRLTDHAAIDGSAHWSPDGARIVFTSERDNNWEIYVMNADGSEQTRLTYDVAQDFVSDWSADGDWIAFFSDRTGNWEIFVMKLDGSEMKRLTSNSDVDAAASFSPDGKKVVFHSDRDGNWEIYMVNTDASELKRLTNHPQSDEYPSWSPDGTFIAFGSDRDGDYEILVMDVNTLETFNITDNPDADRNPLW